MPRVKLQEYDFDEEGRTTLIDRPDTHYSAIWLADDIDGKLTLHEWVEPEQGGYSEVRQFTLRIDDHGAGVALSFEIQLAEDRDRIVAALQALRFA